MIGLVNYFSFVFKFENVCKTLDSVKILTFSFIFKTLGEKNPEKQLMRFFQYRLQNICINGQVKFSTCNF